MSDRTDDRTREDEMGGGGQRACVVVFLFSTPFLSSSRSSSFPLRTRATQQRGTGQGGRRAGGDVEGRAAGLRRAEGGRTGEGNLDKRVTAVDEEDKEANQGRGWPTLLFLPPPLLRGVLTTRRVQI